MKPIDGNIEVAPCRSVAGSIRVPGDKSISHRAVLLATLSDGPIDVAGLSPAADVASSLRAVSALGGRLSQPQGQLESFWASGRDRDFQIQVERDGGARDPAAIDAGNSGTTIRVLLGILAAQHRVATLTGDASLRRRPMGRVVDPLRAMGADITGEDGGRLAPLTVHGRDLVGIAHDLPVASAQVKTALLLAGIQADGETSVTEPTPTRDHTERMLQHLGVPVEQSSNRLIVKSTNLQGGMVTVPGDLSSAAFLLVAAAILPGGAVTIDEVGLNPTRCGILEILRRYGAVVEIGNQTEECAEPRGSVTVRAGDRRPLEIDGGLVVDSVDELPLVGVLGAFAEGETVLRDAAELRVKESDRIAAVCAGLRSMGATVEETPDGFVVDGKGGLQAGVVDPHGDHRIAMAFAVAGLAATGGPTVIQNWACVDVSYPGFAEDVASLLVR